MILEWANTFNPRHEGWYGIGFIHNYPNLGSSGLAPVSSTFLHRLLVMGVG